MERLELFSQNSTHWKKEQTKRKPMTLWRPNCKRVFQDKSDLFGTLSTLWSCIIYIITVVIIILTIIMTIILILINEWLWSNKLNKHLFNNVVPGTKVLKECPSSLYWFIKCRIFPRLIIYILYGTFYCNKAYKIDFSRHRLLILSR